MTANSTKKHTLFLETPYSYLFRDIARNLSSDWSHTLLFSLGYFAYLPTKHFTFAKRAFKNIVPSSADIEDIKQILSIANSNSRSPSHVEVREMAQFHSYLKEFLIKNDVNLVFCHNDLRWQHAIAKKVCGELNIKTLFFEEGYFRPDTITVDAKGVNAYSSLPQSPDFYHHHKTIRRPIRTFSNASSYARIMRLVHFNVFMFLDAMGSGLGLNTKTRNREYSFEKYFELFINKLKLQRSKKNSSALNLPKQYIFVALQVAEDTQTVIHSPYTGTQDFIDDVENAFYSLTESERTDVSLVFKKHPMEIAKNYKFNKESIVLNGDTNELIEKSLGVVLINSSTIAQCLRLGKAVITLGNSFFDIPGLTYKSKRSDLSRSLSLMISGKIKCEQSLYKKFLDYLKFEYQYNMNLYYYSKNDLLSFIDELKKKELE